MKNDFDYIKERFDNSGVNAPDSLDEAAVIDRIRNAEPLQVKRKSRKKIIAISSAAAGLAVVTAAAVAVTSIIGGKILFPQNMPLSGTAKLRQFSSRAEVQDALSDAITFQENLSRNSAKYYSNELNGDVLEYGAGNSAAADGTATGSAMSGSSSSSSTHNSTYVQHTGVDEADSVKTDNEYIYYLRSTGYDEQTVEIYRADGDNTALVGSVKGDSAHFYRDFYVRDNYLVLLSARYNGDLTEAEVLDITDRSKPQYVNAFSQSGSYISSRMIDDTLYMVSDYYAYDADELPKAYLEGATEDEVPADCTYSVETPTESSFLVVSRVELRNGAQSTKTKAILGSAEDIYCNQEHLYVTAAEYEEKYYSSMLNNTFTSSWAVPTAVKTQLVKFDLNDDLDVLASAYVGGSINNQYSLDEYEGNLRVATTSINEGDDFTVNHFYVLDENLALLGQTSGFAAGEDIKAVRYMGSTAYVITYVQTDPLFVIDASDPSNPQITGEVKISGFSSLLVPIDDNTLLGIGYGTSTTEWGEVTDGLKLVTFDVTDMANPQVLDVREYKNYTSDVQYNPKALLVNFERSDYTVPYNAYIGDGHMAGTLNFRIDNGKIDVVDDYVSEKFGRDNMWLERCVYVGDTIYLIGTETDEILAEKYFGDIVEAAYPEKTAIDCVKYK